MPPHAQSSCIAFDGPRRIAIGPLAEVAAQTKQAMDAGAKGPVLIFDDMTSEPVDLDFRGTVADVVARLPAAPSSSMEEPAQAPAADMPRGRGRPRLGVVAREVTLLPNDIEILAKLADSLPTPQPETEENPTATEGSGEV